MVHFPRASVHLDLHRHWLMWALAAAGTASLILALTYTSLASIQTRSSTIKAPSQAVLDAILRYVNEWQKEKDPLITLLNGAQVKSSNVYGVEIEGTKYFYRLSNSASFDPLSQGDELDKYEVITVIDSDTPWEVQIYRTR